MKSKSHVQKLLDTIEKPPELSSKRFRTVNMAMDRVPRSMTGYSLFTFPLEVRNMIYFHLLKASYIDLDWPSCRGHSRIFVLLGVDANVTRPESDRLSILRVSRRLHYEAMCFLYRHNTFCFGL